MIVGVLSVDVGVLDARSLKDKRRVLKSLKDRVRRKFNVSVSEVADHDLIKRGAWVWPWCQWNRDRFILSSTRSWI